MLLRLQIEELARTFTKGNAGHAEKLYLQDIALHSIYRVVVDELVFKGGTALHRIFNLDRFSEDLDFTATKELDFGSLLESVARELDSFGARVERAQREEDVHSFKARLGIRGPLYTGNELSLSFLRVEINTRDDARRPVVVRYTPRFPDIPSFDMLVLTEEEILAEKIRGLLTRAQARDLYDAYHLLQKGVRIDEKLVGRKLDSYGLVYDPAALLERAERARKGWEDLGNLIYSRLPEFENVLKLLEASTGGDRRE